MNHIKAMEAPYLQAQQKRHEHADRIFQDVAHVFICGCRQSVTVNMNSLNANIRLPVVRGPLGANYTHMKSVIAKQIGFIPDAGIGRHRTIFYQHEYFMRAFPNHREPLDLLDEGASPVED